LTSGYGLSIEGIVRFDVGLTQHECLHKKKRKSHQIL